MSRGQVRAAIMVTGVVLALVLLVAIAMGASGWTRVVVLAVLAPLLALTSVAVWRSLSV